PIANEPMSPSFVNMAPRIAVNYSPADGAQAVNRAFADWVGVSRWASAMYDPQVVVDDAVAAKARDLTVNAATETEKIRAIGTFVQSLQYISIDIGVGYGNGMKPRPSNTVLSRGYGDCKDKANLMRAMLKALKIEAYPIAIYSGDPTYVRKEWASPGQFNHCIIAVKVSDATNAPTVIDHPKLGRLMIFDATDEYTPVGDLPDYLQGSNALLVAGENGGLIQMPVTPADFNAWNRETDIQLLDDGSIKGVIRERTRGQESRWARTMFHSLSSSDFSKAIERWLARGANAARLIKLTPQDKQSDGAFNLDVEFSAPNYGQLMQNRLLVFKPAIANRSDSIYLTEKDRKNPVMLDSNSFKEKVEFTLPAGFAVDEMPDPVNIETPFGTYATTYKVQDGKLLFTRSMTTNRGSVAVDKYNEVRDFYSKMRDAEQTPVVLIRK
ncbi:MAG TPA: transglutaminase-like domain-containing protein, partial [Pyrinomonadaceae bacterium]|nr:transglutaminase-like domain-containing protein [Pyrinomonadaceae bacterium]